MKTIIRNATIVNEGKQYVSDLLISKGRIDKIAKNIDINAQYEEIDATGKYLLPGVIDDQVHFREPGLTHKANIHSESRAAVAGGVTSFMEMPNTKPAALTIELLEEKYKVGAHNSIANYSFFMGVSNDNADEALKVNQYKNDICGIKIFMGSSTGNMLVDNYVTLNKIFSEAEILIATHCEDEKVILENKTKYPNANHARFHPLIRDTKACYSSSFSAVQLAKQNNTRLHILHITTAEELRLFTNLIPLKDKKITSEVCVHHLTFWDKDYETKGNLIQCNPAIKTQEDNTALWEALLDDRLDIIATDHAPHTWDEKAQPYGLAPSGLPLVQHSLQQMLEMTLCGKLSIEKVVEKMCHAPAICFEIAERGFIREGYWADLVLVNSNKEYKVTKDNILYKCNWSPFEDKVYHHTIDTTFVNGNKVWSDSQLIESKNGMRLTFDRT